jgi:hypothetical protein
MDKQGSSVRLGVFVGGIAAALIAGFGLGKLINPVSPTAGAQTGAPQTSVTPHVHTGPQAAAGSDVGGLAISAGGYTLTPLSDEGGKISFVIKDPGGKPVTTFATVHEKPLHLIAVRRDLTGYQHLHPSMAPDGTWSVQADLSKPGVWRVFADFTAVTQAGAQSALTLGYDITVPGDYRPQAIPPPARESTVDGQAVAYEGTINVGATSPLLFRVAGNGMLEPYLGSFGHLVVLRDKDLAYIHVHAEPQLSAGAVKFWMAAPSPGTYRMFFDYQMAGKVHTAQFTLVV